MTTQRRPYPCRQKKTYRGENLWGTIQFLFASQTLLIELEEFRAEREKL